jgi:predicted dehydrogenase
MIVGQRHTEKPIRWAMVGGGRGSQIGYIHRCAALRDRTFDLVAGSFDIDPTRGKDFGVELGVAEGRCYPDYCALFAREGARPDGIQAVSIATPNNTHYKIAKAALERGVHVVCEKPLCFTVAEAEALQKLAGEAGKVVGVTYGYAGHQMIEQARAMVANGELGEIRLVNLQFAHGFHSAAVEEKNPSTKWRVDPKFAGPTYVLGDLGTHPLYIAETIAPQLKITRLLCARQSFVRSRAPLEDNAMTLMEYDNGAFGTLWCSAVNAGSMHGQKVRIVGSKASLEWWDERPNQLSFEVQDEPVRILERGMGYLAAEGVVDDRIGAGHPEGLFEAWANLYYRFAIAMDATDRGDTKRLANLRFPDITAGVEGVRWVENCVRSADAGGVWVDYR